MSPSTMVEPTSTLRPDRASTAASSSSSPPPPDVDLPEKLDQCVKETLLLGFSSAVMHSAMRDLTTIREAVLGVDRVKGLIAQGYSPEMIGSMIASKQELLDGFKSVEGGVRDLALGYTVVQVATQFDSATLSDDPSLDSVRLRRFQKMVQSMKADPPKSVVEFAKIDYAGVEKYLLDEKQNGSLVGDPAWDDFMSKRKKRNSTWRERLQLSLEELNQGFQLAADEVDWNVTSQVDSNLIKVMPASALISLLLVNYESAEVRLSKGPLPPGQSNPIGDAVNLSRLGSDFRSDVLDFCKRMANEQFIEGNFARAEQLYDTAFQAGTNDATVTINRAAALLKIERFEEAQKCCTLGLTQLDVAKQGSTSAGGKGVAEGKGSARPSQRSRPMLASQETLNELRWKAFVRRGRAHKGILMQLGGLSTSGSGRDEYENGSPNDGGGDSGDSDEDRQAEARGHMLLAARSDFAAALSIDPLDDIPRQEMASLTIHPLQRRPSGQDISKGLALASISQLDKERRRNSQESSMPAKPRRSESS